jgi:cell division protein FtsQ
MKTKNNKTCNSVLINIEGVHQHVFVNKADVLTVLSKNKIKAGQALEAISLKNAEEELEKNPWVKDAELFFDNHQSLHVEIEEREPVARVFTVTGQSFYIDSAGMRLPASEDATARLMVFTSFPSDKKILSKPDSLVLDDIKQIARHISADSFMNEQTAQINITPQRTYEITPVVGDQVIRLGNAENLDKKFAKLLAFYQQVWSRDFERYSVIDVQYKGQVVAVRRGEGNPAPDVAKALHQLKKADAQLQAALSDTTYAAPVIINKTKSAEHQSIEKKKEGKRAVKKSAVKKPKAVMKKKQ